VDITKTTTHTSASLATAVRARIAEAREDGLAYAQANGDSLIAGVSFELGMVRALLERVATHLDNNDLKVNPKAWAWTLSCWDDNE